MKAFMDKDFLLKTETARHLYFDIAKDLPIYDYHCHLDPKEIYEDKYGGNLATLWLGGDHYKWRVMRICGIDERFITGDAPDREKFRAFASVMPKLIGNPIYHWAHLELQRYFGIDTPLSSDTADEIFDKTEKMLASPEFSARNLILRSNVAVVCTTDDPKDSLEYHIKLKEEGFSARVLPTFRPEKAIGIEHYYFIDYINSLPVKIKSAQELLSWLFERAEFFKEVGCLISDHGFLDIPYAPCSPREADRIFRRRMSGKTLSPLEVEKYMTYIFLNLCRKYHELGFAMQIHIGPIRNNNTRMFERLGPDAGFDSMAETFIARKLISVLDHCDCEGKLPKTILYGLRPNDNYVLASMCGDFPGECEGKIQFGSAWWFCDHIEGMRNHAKDHASLSAFGTFIGMLTDSRSLLSYPRHEYFRRIICDVIGSWVEDGLFPNDEELLRELVEGICCKNVIKYLGF